MFVALVFAALLSVACAPPPVSVPIADGGSCTLGAPVLAPELVNGRDLGGITTAQNGSLQCGQVYRSAAPSRLQESGCAGFKALGIKSVIDLRISSERANVPNSTCVEPQARTLLAPMPIPFNVSASDYLADLHADESVRTLFSTLGDDANYPVLFHCTYGRDRSGVAAALILLTLGVGRDEILADYQRTRNAGISTTPDSLSAALDEVERLGGVEAHLTSIGVTAESIAVLRRRLLPTP